jgi:rhodanese-related sulfurtransferase/transcriptional regulator with XRE-family HTH domain
MISAVEPQQAAKLVAAGDIDLVDVREPREWATGHLPGARNVPLEQLRADPEGSLPHDKVLLVCAKGTRSQVAAQIAERRGLVEIYSLSGGTKSWAQAGLPIEVPKAVERAAKPAPASKPQVKSEAKPELKPEAKIEPKPEAKIEAAPDELEPGLDAIIGKNVRELRTQRGLTLDALGKRAGVSRALLGQIELGRAVPSINVVWKLAGALEVPFATLVATASRVGTTVIRRSKAKQLVSSEGRFGSRALFPPGQKGSVEFYELWLAAHSREDAEAHAPGTRENLVVTAGRLELQIGSERHKLNAGDAIVFSADVPHAYVNLGSDECWMCLVMTYAAAG